ncbi:MAG: hypothetical protein V4687_06760 [Bacteroidota bacterium]
MQTLKEWTSFAWKMIKDKTQAVDLPSAVSAISNMESFKLTGIHPEELSKEIKILIEAERNAIKDRIREKLKAIRNPEK